MHVPSFPVTLEPHEPHALLDTGLNPGENLAKKWAEVSFYQLNGDLKEFESCYCCYHKEFDWLLFLVVRGSL